tara:strand:+ start:510 stop:695 length:186 start_codon:yes stop_codon:yes gene_type:complete
MIKNLVRERIAELKLLEQKYDRSRNAESDFYRKSRIGTNLRQIRDLLELNNRVLDRLNGVG